MKKIFSNNRLIVIAFFTVFSIGGTNMAMATETTDSLPVSLKYIGNIHNQPLYQLSFAGNPEENDFTIVVKDNEGNSLYRENIKGEKFYKKFLLNNEEIGDEKISFEIFSKKSGKSVTFEVTRQSRFVEEMVINKSNK
jgi:hypothetical protein